MEEGAAGGGAAASLAERRDAVAVCAAALRDLRAVMFSCANGDLARFAGELAELRALAGAGLVAVTAEAEERGVIDASQYASTAAWVADAAWFSRRESATVAKAAALVRDTVYAPVADALTECDVDLGCAVVVAEEFAKLAPDLVDAARPIVLDQMLNVAAEHGPRAVRRLKDEILARYGAQGEFEEREERRRRHIELSAGRQSASGMWDYQLTVDTEGRAVLEATIGPGSAPKPQPDDGPRDTRPVARRRGEALIDALRRAASATRHVPNSPKAILMLTMDYDKLAGRVRARSDLRSDFDSGFDRDVDRDFDSDRPHGRRVGYYIGRLGEPVGQPVASRAATVLGSRAGGDLLSVETVRRIACDAGIVPVVLGSAGEILDQGQLKRLFTTAQVRALWLRDGHCSFPGCDIPAAWCDAHHLVHWVDGGPTDLANAALLCGRHHTIVHRDGLAGHVAPAFESAAASDIGAQGERWKRSDRSNAAKIPRNRHGTNRRRALSGLWLPETGSELDSHPPPAVSWDLRPGSYRVPESGFIDSRATA